MSSLSKTMIQKMVVGITGSIGCGKTTVSNYLIQKGYSVIDTDKLSHQLTKPNTKGYNLIVNNFFDVLNPSLEINRKKVANIIFNDEEKRLLFNSLIHPLIKDEVISQINNLNEKLIFIDVPLLFESKFNQLCNVTICVSSSLEDILTRVSQRNALTFEEVLKILRTQMPLEEKEKLSDFVITNDKDLKHLYSQIDEILLKIKGINACQKY